MTDGYTAVAASWIEISEDTLQSDFVKAWLHITLAIFPIGTLLLLYFCDPIQLLLGDKTWTKLEDEHTHGTVAALIQISVIFSVYVFILDIIGMYYTITSDIITYDSNSAFYLSTVTGVMVDLGTVIWVVVVLAISCHQDFKNIIHCIWRMDETCDSSKNIKKLMSTVMVAPMLNLAKSHPLHNLGLFFRFLPCWFYFNSLFLVILPFFLHFSSVL